MSKKNSISISDKRILKLKKLIKEKKRIAKELAVIAQERERTRRKLAIFAEKLKESYAAKEETSVKELKKFKLAIESTSEQIIITDRNGLVVYGNPATEKLTGYTREEAVGMKAGKLWGGHMDKAYYEHMWKTISIDKKTFIGELTNTRKNGEAYIARLTINPILDDFGEVEFFVAVERDVTKEREIDRAKTEFVSVASHQLRTPLTGIKWFTELMLSDKKNPLNDQQKDYVQQIAVSNERLIYLVNDLLNVSRIDTGKKFDIVPIKIDIVPLLSDVVKEQEIVAKQLGKEITIKASLPKKIKVMADSEKIRQAFQNLINNAIKYSKKGGVVKIDCARKDKEEICSIADNGIGIPLSQQRRVFQKFFRSENALIAHTDGTGLGLYIVKAIVEGHKGRVWFESKEGVGTTFFISLPIDTLSNT